MYLQLSGCKLPLRALGACACSVISKGDVRGVLGSESRQGIFKFSYGGKKAVSSYVTLTGVRANRYGLMEMYSYLFTRILGL